MAPPAPPVSQSASEGALRERLCTLAEALAERESEHTAALEQAFAVSHRLHGRVLEAVDAFHSVLAARGLAHLRIRVGEPRMDDKHIRAVQFEISRGRTIALVSVKSRGEVTLVGPFKDGKTEGPCETMPWAHASTLELTLADFLERFIEQAVTP